MTMLLGGAASVPLCAAVLTLLAGCSAAPPPPSAAHPTASSTSGSASPGLDLRAINWKEVAVPGEACRSSTQIQLHNGRALIPDPGGQPAQPGGDGPLYRALDQLGEVTYGDLEASGHDDAFVYLSCNNNGGTAVGALLYSFAVFSGRTGALQLLGVITPKQQPADDLPTLMSPPQISPGRVAIDELWYGSKDFTCCPTGKATTIWTYSSSPGLLAAQTVVVASPSESWPP